MNLSEYISHDDRTLQEHLAGLKIVADYLLEEKVQTLYSKEDLKSLVYRLISYHDLAKASIFFQLYLSNALVLKGNGHLKFTINELKLFLDSNIPKIQEWTDSPELKEHAHFGAWTFLSTVELSQRYNLDNMISMKILKRHHGYLRDFGLATINPTNHKNQFRIIEDNIEYSKVENLLNSIGLPFCIPNITEILDGFKLLQFKKLEIALAENQDPSYYFKTLFTYSFLLSADKGDVMLKDKSFQRTNINSEVIDQFKSSKLSGSYKINELREKAYTTAIENVEKFGNQNFFSITLPTGLGKTFTAYKSALLLKEKFAPKARIVYCLPFTSIIDQNGNLFKEILTNSSFKEGLIGIHHHLAVPENKDQNEIDYPEWEYFIAGWQKEITISTFVQLWESIFANHNKELRKFHNLVNSIIILDEVQAINPTLLPALEFVMESMATFFDTKFILVTATQPIIMPLKTKELCLFESSDYFFKRMNRTLLDKSLLSAGHITEEELVDHIYSDFVKSPQSILVICNTIRYSQKVFEILTEKLKNKDLFYLSASIIPYSREVLLNKYISPLLKKKRSFILVSTQVIEAGVDVDFDLVYRDFAPLSSINQAAGRCNRNSTKNISKVKLFRSGKEKIYDPTLLSVTEKTLEKYHTEIPESKYFELNKAYFSGIKDKVQDNSFTSKRLIDSILKLKFEDVGTNKDYRLIVEKYKSYNYFIPINYEASELWVEYLQLMAIEDHFERKQKIKSHFPQMMKYIIKIPDYINKPPDVEKEKYLIYDQNWATFYDKIFGYKKAEAESPIEIF
ncbi:CRISPR-associated helicase, Cas3 family [Aquiflexum balticum DSM 16537]|uniref:CRISPR-associated helicase, Cas3 family n=1 Tax=Aquiflexum balticum DSM 16537 TaxID=758820 RepID=A0A1W2H925_9BACT|nr:CRISPR-associated helicase/endonuclease Cas3 [Aquiflexum balticum]SMD45357.1 CRISPR-associated helicase, Cas3 family [Aquiflexum balticum DSM 16537]